MAEIFDAVSFEGYEDVVEVSRLRKASSYLDEVKAEFKPPEGSHPPSMFSTKLRGGLEFRKGELTCWAGYNGHRKSMFAGQVALDLIAQKKRVLIASFEMQPARTLARMARQGWGSEVPNDHELATFSHLGHHVFIDSMMMVCASEESMDEQKQFITDLVRMAQETSLHVHLVAHCRKPQAGEDKPPTKYDLRGSAAISDQAHNVVTVWANKLKKAKLEEGGDPSFMNDPDALITVEKQRNGRWEGRCKLWFEERSMRFCDDGSLQTPVYAGLQ
jgi:twinkle protein